MMINQTDYQPKTHNEGNKIMAKNTNNEVTDEVIDEATPAASITPKELALLLDTDPKTLRRFLRAMTSDRPGRGGRWVIPADQVDAIRDRFNNWGGTKRTVFAFSDEDDADNEG